MDSHNSPLRLAALAVLAFLAAGSTPAPAEEGSEPSADELASPAFWLARADAAGPRLHPHGAILAWTRIRAGDRDGALDGLAKLPDPRYRAVNAGALGFILLNEGARDLALAVTRRFLPLADEILDAEDRAEASGGLVELSAILIGPDRWLEWRGMGVTPDVLVKVHELQVRWDGLAAADQTVERARAIFRQRAAEQKNARGKEAQRKAGERWERYALIRLAKAHAARGRWKEADAVFNRLAAMEDAQREIASLRKDLDEARAEGGDVAAARHVGRQPLLVRALASAGQLEEAEALARGIRGHDVPWVAIAVAAARVGDDERLARLLAGAPFMGGDHYAVGRALLEAGRLEAATSFLATQRLEKDEEVDLRLRLARAHLAAGARDLARRQIDAAESVADLSWYAVTFAELRAAVGDVEGLRRVLDASYRSRLDRPSGDGVMLVFVGAVGEPLLRWARVHARHGDRLALLRGIQDPDIDEESRFKCFVGAAWGLLEIPPDYFGNLGATDDRGVPANDFKGFMRLAGQR